MWRALKISQNGYFKQRLGYRKRLVTHEMGELRKFEPEGIPSTVLSLKYRVTVTVFCSLCSLLVDFHMSIANPLSASPTKWSNTLKQTNCLSV